MIQQLLQCPSLNSNACSCVSITLPAPIVNANQSVMGATAVLRVIGCHARVLIPQAAER